jgi:polyadenylate-binding protein
MQFKDKTLQVLVHTKKNEREDVVDNFTNLYVQNIPSDFTEAQLINLFKEFGDITSVRVKDDKSGTGFVKFTKHEDAKKAIEALNAKKELIKGKMLLVQKHISKQEN